MPNVRVWNHQENSMNFVKNTSGFTIYTRRLLNLDIITRPGARRWRSVSVDFRPFRLHLGPIYLRLGAWG